MRQKIDLTLIIILTLALLLLFGFVSQNTSSLIHYLAIFVIIYLATFLIVRLLIVSIINLKLNRKTSVMSAILAFIPTLIIAINTLSNLSIIDAVLAFGAPLLILWYVNKNY